MNRELLKCMNTERIPVERLISLLQTFALKHSARALPDLLETADTQNATNRQFLLSILEAEVRGRNERRRKRNYSAAHFPPNVRPLEEFDPEELESGMTQAQLDRLKELSWLDNGGNLVFAGPPGLGKTMVAGAPRHQQWLYCVFRKNGKPCKDSGHSRNRANRRFPSQKSEKGTAAYH